MSNPRNQCGACGLDFASVNAFDRHRVGVHAYTYSEGLKSDPMREDGRRCLTVDELAEIGLVPNARGLFHDPVKTAKAASSFRPEHPVFASPDDLESPAGS